MEDDQTCDHAGADQSRLFCSLCGKVREAGSLRRVRLMGPVGVHNSNSPALDMFWRTGDPSAFSKPGDLDYTPGISKG